jgi:hypothetical protein
MKITNPNHIFEEPTQVKFFDPYNGEQLAGIGYKNEIICGCCGTTMSVALALRSDKPIETLEWVSLVDEIIGE